MATTKEEIFAKMRATDLELPKIRDVGIAYATWLSKVFDLLPQEHQQNAILLGESPRVSWRLFSVSQAGMRT